MSTVPSLPSDSPANQDWRAPRVKGAVTTNGSGGAASRVTESFESPFATLLEAVGIGGEVAAPKVPERERTVVDEEQDESDGRKSDAEENAKRRAEDAASEMAGVLVGIGAQVGKPATVPPPAPQGADAQSDGDLLMRSAAMREHELNQVMPEAPSEEGLLSENREESSALYLSNIEESVSPLAKVVAPSGTVSADEAAATGRSTLSPASEALSSSGMNQVAMGESAEHRAILDTMPAGSSVSGSEPLVRSVPDRAEEVGRTTAGKEGLSSLIADAAERDRETSAEIQPERNDQSFDATRLEQTQTAGVEEAEARGADNESSDESETTGGALEDNPFSLPLEDVRATAGDAAGGESFRAPAASPGAPLGADTVRGNGPLAADFRRGVGEGREGKGAITAVSGGTGQAGLGRVEQKGASSGTPELEELAVHLGGLEGGGGSSGQSIISDSAQRVSREAPVERTKILQAIERVRKTLTGLAEAQEAKSVSLRLDPPSLGSMTVEVSFRDGELHARLAPELPQVAMVLRERSHELHAALRKMGLSVDHVRVSIDTATTSTGSEGDGTRQGSSRQSGDNRSFESQRAPLSERLIHRGEGANSVGGAWRDGRWIA